MPAPEFPVFIPFAISQHPATGPALHPASQAAHRDARIVSALERLGELMRNLTWDTGTALGLSPLQVQLLSYLHGHPPLTAASLARHFHLTKPTVSVALRGMEQKGLIKQTTSSVDGRVRDIIPTASGRKTALKTAGHLDALLPLLATLESRERDSLFNLLYQLLDAARRQGLIQVERMCATCLHYTTRQDHPYCNLLHSRLTPETHRVDCPEHEERRA